MKLIVDHKNMISQCKNIKPASIQNFNSSIIRYEQAITDIKVLSDDLGVEKTSTRIRAIHSTFLNCYREKMETNMQILLSEDKVNGYFNKKVIIKEHLMNAIKTNRFVDYDNKRFQEYMNEKLEVLFSAIKNNIIFPDLLDGGEILLTKDLNPFFNQPNT